MMLRARFALRRLSKANLTEVTVKSPEVRISRPGAVVGAGLILCAGLLASCGTLKEPEAAYQARCGKCHGPSDVQNWGRQRRNADARQAWLDEFLRLHYPPPEAERPLIIEYIQSQIAGHGT
jgi:hypothetical protein